MPFTILFMFSCKGWVGPLVQPTIRMQPQAGFAPHQHLFAMQVEMHMHMPSWDSAGAGLMLGVLAKSPQPRRGS